MGAIIALSSSALSALTFNPIGPTTRCWQICDGVTTDTSTCTDLLCTGCKDLTMRATNGISAIDHRSVKQDCNTGKCSCQTTGTSYVCSDGYYGTATSASAGCTACPDNATCAGGNNSTFVCAKGYYKNGNVCTRCPASGGVYGTTDTTGATSITSCYLPSGTSFSDGTGSGTYTSKCYYAN